VFDALLWRKSAELAEAFIESNNLLVLFDNQKSFCFDHTFILPRKLSDVK